VGILFPHINVDARSKSLQIYNFVLGKIENKALPSAST